MQISHSTVAILAAAVISTHAIPQNTQTLSTNQGPTIITGDKMGAAAFIDGYSSTLVVYQAADTSVRALRGYDPPLNTFSYSNSLLLAANVARNDTPLAITIEHDAAEYGAGPPRNVVSVLSASLLLLTSRASSQDQASYSHPATAPPLLPQRRHLPRRQLRLRALPAPHPRLARRAAQ